MIGKNFADKLTGKCREDWLFIQNEFPFPIHIFLDETVALFRFFAGTC
jgi:hypothetical protein